MMNPVTGLSLGRIAVGVVSLAKPDLISSALAAPTGPTTPAAASPLITQWFGSREIALGTLTLLARGSARRNLVLVGAGVDAADAATAYVGLAGKQLSKEVGGALVAIASVAAVSGLLGLRVRKQTKVVAA